MTGVPPSGPGGSPPPGADVPPGPGPGGPPPGGPGDDLRWVRPQADNDKLISALCYIFWFLVPIIILVTDMKNSRFNKIHAYQGIVFGAAGIVFYILVSICWTIATSIFFALGCIVGFLWLVPLAAGLYFAYLVFAKEAVVLPGVTDATKAVFKDL